MRLGSYPNCAVSVGGFFFFSGRSERFERFKRGDGVFGQRNGSLRIPPLVQLGKKISNDI